MIRNLLLCEFLFRGLRVDCQTKNELQGFQQQISLRYYQWFVKTSTMNRLLSTTVSADSMYLKPIMCHIHIVSQASLGGNQLGLALPQSLHTDWVSTNLGLTYKISPVTWVPCLFIIDTSLLFFDYFVLPSSMSRRLLLFLREHGQEHSSIRVGFVTYNSQLHFYNVKVIIASSFD